MTNNLFHVLLAFCLVSCASVFDVPRYDASKKQCSIADLVKMQEFIAGCKAAGSSDAVCFNKSVVKYCGDINDKKHQIGIEA